MYMGMWHTECYVWWHTCVGCTYVCTYVHMGAKSQPLDFIHDLFLPLKPETAESGSLTCLLCPEDMDYDTWKPTKLLHRMLRTQTLVGVWKAISPTLRISHEVGSKNKCESHCFYSHQTIVKNCLVYGKTTCISSRR